MNKTTKRFHESLNGCNVKIMWPGQKCKQIMSVISELGTFLAARKQRNRKTFRWSTALLPRLQRPLFLLAVTFITWSSLYTGNTGATHLVRIVKRTLGNFLQHELEFHETLKKTHRKENTVCLFCFVLKYWTPRVIKLEVTGHFRLQFVCISLNSSFNRLRIHCQQTSLNYSALRDMTHFAHILKMLINPQTTLDIALLDPFVADK